MNRNQRVIVNTRNRMLSQNIQMSLDTRYTDLNNNILVVGGSGSGKTYRFVKPNLMQMSSSYVITDPKGEIMRSSAGFLREFGYQIKVLNLLNAKGMKKSSRYNPFRYIRNDMDIVKLVTTFMAATKKKDAQSGEQYWDDMAGLLLQALFYYVYYEGVEVDGQYHYDFKGVMKLVNMLDVEEDERTGARKQTELDGIFTKLKQKNPNHPAVISYFKALKGAADSVRCIISTLNSRTTCLQTNEILDLLSDDEMDITTIGIRKTVVYCMIPDNDKTYNFLVSMLYQQMFQQLYHQADFVYDGELPIHVTFLLDEFANVSLPDEFLSWLTTMRSRNMSSIIILQNLAQIKALYKDHWENIPGNCDTLIYLGGNEQTTHEYISKLLDKQTIDKQTHGQTTGKQGSASTNEDVLGRELMLPGEVRKMNRKKCLIIINGKDPAIDYKIRTNLHPLWKDFCKLSRAYHFDGRVERYTKNIRLGSNMRQIKLLEQTESELLRQEEKRLKEEYEEERQVALLTGEALPEAPKTQIKEMELWKLYELVEELEQTKAKLPPSELEADELERTISSIAEKMMLQEEDNNKNSVQLLLEHYAEKEVKEVPQENKTIVQADIVNEVSEQEKKKMQRLKAVTELTSVGFSIRQIHLLSPILSELSIGEITKLFRPDMDEETIKVVLDILSF